MESLQPDDQQRMNPLEFIEPSFSARQTSYLFEMQQHHQQVLSATGIASLAYGTLGAKSQDQIDNTPPEYRRYFVYRRMHPRHSATTSNVEFGVMFLHRDQAELENGFNALPIHVPVGEIVDGSVAASDKNKGVFSDNERKVVHDLLQAILSAHDCGILPDIKYDLSAIVDKTSSTDKPTPLT